MITLCRILLVVAVGAVFSLGTTPVAADEIDSHVRTTAYEIPKHTTSEGSGYFSLIEGKNGRIYIGTAKYGSNAYLVEFDPKTKKMRVVVDCRRTIGSKATGFAAQAKIHTRNNVGDSGKIYFGTKQGYPLKDEKRTDYAGGYPMVFDPTAAKTRVYGIPVKHHGIISITPDESRDVAYISTGNDARPIESTHFVMLNLRTGKYRDLMDCQHMYAFIVLDHRNRAYHPILGGEIARYDPAIDKVQRLRQSIDGKPPSVQSRLADPKSHPINWDISPDRKVLYAVPMSSGGLYAYDLSRKSDDSILAGRFVGKLLPKATKTDCRAVCVAPNGTVWTGVAARLGTKDAGLRLVSYTPGEDTIVDHGRAIISNPDYTTFTDDSGKPLKWHHGVVRLASGQLVPRYHVLAICAARDGTIYFTTLYPLTLHAWRPK